MALPKQIQERAAALAAFEKQQDEQSNAPDAAAVQEQDGPQGVEQVQGQTEYAAEGQEHQGRQDGEGQEGHEGRQEQALQEQVAPNAEPEEKWEHKYRRLQGKYDAEVPRLHQELKELRAAMQQMQQHLVATQQAQQSAPAQSEKAPSLVTEEDVDAYGADLVDLQRRVAQEVMQKEMAKLRQESDQIKQQLTQVKGSTFEARLHQAMPDFQVVNQDPRWVAWLNEFDPLLQGPRRAIAQAAYAREDVNAVKAYVDLFKQSVGATSSAQQTKQSKQAELQKQVQPARVASTAVPASAGQQNRVYSQREMATGYERIRTLISRGKLEEASALEAELSAAYMEGRVSG